MNTVGRQRPGVPAAHHQRQHLDNFLESSSNRRWLQSTGPQHLQSSSNAAPPVQDFEYYNGGGSRFKNQECTGVCRDGHRSFSGGSDLFAEPLTPLGNSQRTNVKDF